MANTSAKDRFDQYSRLTHNEAALSSGVILWLCNFYPVIGW